MICPVYSPKAITYTTSYASCDSYLSPLSRRQIALGRADKKRLVSPFLKYVDTKRFFKLLNYWKEKRNESSNWEAGIRTPIGGSRVRSLTVRRPPKGFGHIMNREWICQQPISLDA